MDQDKGGTAAEVAAPTDNSNPGEQGGNPSPLANHAANGNAPEPAAVAKAPDNQKPPVNIQINFEGSSMRSDSSYQNLRKSQDAKVRPMTTTAEPTTANIISALTRLRKGGAKQNDIDFAARISFAGGENNINVFSAPELPFQEQSPKATNMFTAPDYLHIQIPPIEGMNRQQTHMTMFGDQRRTSERQLDTPLDTPTLRTLGEGAGDEGIVLNQNSSYHPQTPGGEGIVLNKSSSYPQSLKAAADINYWSSEQDPIYIYNLEKRLQLQSPENSQIEAMTRWYMADIKGHKKSQYTKQVAKMNDKIQTVTDLDEMELLTNFEDGWPFLTFRKSVKRCKLRINILALSIIKKKWFEAATIIVIMVNCMTLTTSKADVEPTEAENMIENVFLVLYSVEMVLKILGLGFIFGKGAYLTDPFNILDFFIVMSSYLSMLQNQDSTSEEGGLSLSSLRAFRVLRPLRAVNNIPGLRLIVQSIMSALPLLKDTIIVLLFFFLIFAIGGVNLFSGMLRQRCINIEDGGLFYDEEGNEVICGDVASCEDGYFCGKRILNPNYDVTNFDNIFWAMLVIFQCVTLEGWSDVMVLYQKVYHYYVFLFFVPLVFIGAFFLLNLTLAVINTSFNQSQERIKKAKLDHQEELKQLFQVEKTDDIMDDQTGTQVKENLNDIEKKGAKIGIMNFFVAKKAAIKMRAFARHYHEQKRIDDEIKRREEEAQVKLELEIRSPRSPIRGGRSPKSRSPQGTPRTQRVVSPRSPVHPHFLGGFTKPPLRKDSSSNNLPTPQPVKKQGTSFTSHMDALTQKKGHQRQMSHDYPFNTIEQNSRSRIKEESSEQSNRSVEQFFNALNDDDDLLYNVDVKSLNDCSEDQSEPKSVNLSSFLRPQPSAKVVMAFNDLRRDNARDLFSPKSSENDNKNIPAHLKILKKTKESRKHKEAQQIRERIKKDLDFEKLIKKPQKNKETTPLEEKSESSEMKLPEEIKQSTKLQIFTDQHQYDLSFLKSDAGFFSDNEDQRVANDQSATLILTDRQSASQHDRDASVQMAESVILSDSSLASAMDRYKQPLFKSRTNHKKKAKMLQQQPLQREVENTLKRMLTSEKTLQTNPGENDVDESIYGAQSVKKQLDVYFNLNDVRKKRRKSDEEPLTPKTQSQRAAFQRSAFGKKKEGLISKSLAMAKAKKNQANIYNQVSLGLVDVQDQNPYMSFNRREQKIVINPDEQYRSASQDAVFELRKKKDMFKNIKKRNPYIRLQQDSQRNTQRKKQKTLYEDKDAFSAMFITTPFQPYQIKSKQKPSISQEVDLENDDEDAIVLQMQPYETIMSIGHSDLLNHLNTKFLTRRSDIIVSSTLSITLAPQDSFKPTQFAKLDSDRVDEWVDLRQKFRASKIKQCKLIIDTDEDVSSSDDSDHSAEITFVGYNQSSVEQNSQSQNVLDISDASGGGGGGKSRDKNPFAQGHVKKKLPRTLQRTPLTPDQVMLLSDDAKREYNLQKSKHDVISRQYKNVGITPSETKFSLQEAQALVNGKYFQDEDGAIEINMDPNNLAGMKSNKPVFLNRSGLEADLSLAIFEQAVKNIIVSDTRGEWAVLNKLKETDHIPEDIKTEFNLPKDMKDSEVDFYQIRLLDNTLAIKQPVWSGQEVLAISLNVAQSKQVISRIAAVRVWPKGFMNMIKKVRSVLKISCMNSLFENTMTLCVLLNTIVMSMDKYGIDPETEKSLNYMNTIFTYIFIYEMGVKLLAIGPKKYSASKWNLLDGSVVLLSLVEIIAESTQNDSNAGGSSLSAFRTVRVFRTFRVLRVARILRALHSMQVIIGVITRSFKSFMYVILLLFVFVFIYALLGIQIYQGKFDFGPDEQLPRGNFEEFGIAFVTVFQVLTMENWQEVMYTSMRSARGSTFMKALTAIYFISWIFIGNFILLNLFLAILIDSFNSEESETAVNEDDQDQAIKKAAEIKAVQLQLQKKKRLQKLTKMGTTFMKKTMHRQSHAISSDKKPVITFTGEKKGEDLDQVDDFDELGTDAIRTMLIANKIINVKEKKKPVVIPGEIECENSIYLFHRSGVFRKVCFHIQQHRYFDRVVMFLILVSSLQLAFETYIMKEPEDSNIKFVNEVFGEIFTYCFVVECLLKVVALGFMMDTGSYLRESWNQLDFFIVATSLIDRALANSEIAAFRILRMLRILRPLRVVSHNVQLKMIVIALLDAGGSILNVIIVVLVVWLMFAIFAINTFKGHFFYCSIEKYVYQDQYECIAKGGEWMRYDSNFDDIGQAMMTLFIVSSLEGWPTIMYQALDITRVDYGPEFQGNIKMSIFFIVFILIGSFFFLNFFIGVLFLKYSEAQKREIAGFTEQQLFWREIQAMILKAKCSHAMRNQPQVWEPWRLKAWRLVNSHTFEAVIIVVIILNMIQMAITFEGSSESMDTFMDMTNLIFTAIFIVEACLKIFAFRLSYFQTSWNKFDFFVVVSSILDITLTYYQEQQSEDMEDDRQQQSALSVGPQLARVLRVLRVSRVLRIAGHYKGLKSLLNTIVLSIGALLNVFMLLMLFFFILAILGQFMFNEVKSGDVIDEYKNFEVFDRSFLLLFSISTGEDWNKIMHDCNRTLPDCIEGETCGSPFAPAYFIAFIILVTYVMLNLFILVIIQQFEKLYLDKNSPLARFNQDFGVIHEVWVKFTARNRCLKLKDRFIFDFMKAVPAPIGFTDLKESELKKAVLKLNIKSEEGYIYFNELLYRLMRNQYVNFKLNKKMQIRELITQFKLFNLTMKSIKQNKQDLHERFVQTVGGVSGDTVNPFLTQMYYRISFLSWMNYMNRLVKQEQIQQIKQTNYTRSHTMGIDTMALAQQQLNDLSQTFEQQYEEVEIEVEHISEWTVTDDEEEPDETNPLKSSNDSGELEGKSSMVTLTIIKEPSSPSVYRMRSRQRMEKSKLSRLKRLENQTDGKVTECVKHSLHLYLRPQFNSMVAKLVSQNSLSRTSKRIKLHKQGSFPRQNIAGIRVSTETLTLDEIRIRREEKARKAAEEEAAKIEEGKEGDAIHRATFSNMVVDVRPPGTATGTDKSEELKKKVMIKELM